MIRGLPSPRVQREDWYTIYKPRKLSKTVIVVHPAKIRTASFSRARSRDVYGENQPPLAGKRRDPRRCAMPGRELLRSSREEPRLRLPPWRGSFPCPVQQRLGQLHGRCVPGRQDLASWLMFRGADGILSFPRAMVGCAGFVPETSLYMESWELGAPYIMIMVSTVSTMLLRMVGFRFPLRFSFHD